MPLRRPSREGGYDSPDDGSDRGPNLAEVIERQGAFKAGQRYLDGRVFLHAYLRIRDRTVERNAGDFCAVVRVAEADRGGNAPEAKTLERFSRCLGGPEHLTALGHRD